MLAAGRPRRTGLSLAEPAALARAEGRAPVPADPSAIKMDVTILKEAGTVGDIGKEGPEIEVLPAGEEAPAREPTPADQSAAPSREAAAQPGPAVPPSQPGREPVPG